MSNVASRHCDEAKPGLTLISPQALTKVENAVKVEPVGEFELKGIRRPQAAYNVVAAVSPTTGLAASFVARAVEYDGHEILIFRNVRNKNPAEAGLKIQNPNADHAACFTTYARCDLVRCLSRSAKLLELP